MKSVLLLSTFCLANLCFGCGGQKEAKMTAATEPSPTATPAPSPAAAGSNELKTVSSGLQYQDLVVGIGQKPGFNQKVRIAYVGKLQNGTIFDKGADDFKLGVGEVIKGWDQGIAGGGGVDAMREGGKRKLIIPPALGYGDKPMSIIPANSTLIFEVELLRVNKPTFGMK
jgi:FKBP-type peptidyl-prolyl cis-trans isomerase